MATPLYKKLKKQGTSIYAFPGAEEDINQKNENYKIYFSKFCLINLPKSQTALDDEPKRWDFQESFYTSSENTPSSYGDRVINSLRNYVANHETTIKETLINDNEFLYDNSVLKTTTERIFFKWCKKLNLIQFEEALEGDEYFENLQEFEPNNVNDNNFFPENLWKEREVFDSYISKFYESPNITNKLEVEYKGSVNYKEGDFIEFYDIQNSEFPEVEKYLKVLQVLQPNSSEGFRVIYDIEFTGSQQIETEGYSELVYNKLVRYIGEIQGNNNVVSQNQFFDQTMAFIGDDAGETPDILFRTTFDNNYSPNLQYPLLPSQFQPEIQGAENFNSPINKNPQDFPGDQFAQYDNDNNLDEYNYLNKSGDVVRRSGEYFGVSGDRDNIQYNGDTIDGISLDFNTDHYVKMNIIGSEISNFDEFNTTLVNDEFPKDFDFNAILWYYDVEDVNGNVATNLYGISFLDNPQNNEVNTGSEFPPLKKLVATNKKDGTAYQFSLNRHTTISSEQPQPKFTNENVNNLFGFNLFNEALRRLIVFNDSAQKIISDSEKLQSEVNNLKQLVYTSTDLQQINARINNLDNLLRLFSTNQITDSDSIKVRKNNSVSPPEIQLINTEGRYSQINYIQTSNLFDSSGVLPQSIDVPDGKDFLVFVENDDKINQSFTSGDNLTIFLNQDLSFKQTAKFIIEGSEDSTQNKKLNLLITYSDNQNTPTLREAFTSLDLPVYFNETQRKNTTSFKWKQINQDIESMSLSSNGQTVSLGVSRVSGLKPGDNILIENVLIDENKDIKIDGQYKIESIDIPQKIINVDYTQNRNLTTYIDSETSNGNLSNGDVIEEYYTMGSFRLNKGWEITITRIDELPTSTFNERYLIDVKPKN
jgi:hypothetical protein